MAQLKLTCSVVNGSQVVAIPGVNETARIKKYNIFMLEGDLAPYTVAENSTYSGSTTYVTLTGAFVGPTNPVAAGRIVNSFTYPDQIPLIENGDVGTAAVYTAAMHRIQSMLRAISPDGIIQYAESYEAVLQAVADLAATRTQTIAAKDTAVTAAAQATSAAVAAGTAATTATNQAGISTSASQISTGAAATASSAANGASTSANQAQQARTDAIAAKDIAVQANATIAANTTTASNAATSATASASSAAGSAATATAKATQVTADASNSAANALTAQQAADNATASKNAAASSATTAASHVTTVITARDVTLIAKDAAVQAKVDAEAAAASVVNNTQASADNATAAAASATSAATSAQTATDKANSISSAATVAQNNATAAVQARNEAETFRDEAQLAAEQATAGQINSDWNATTGVQKILNKPVLAAVATSGNKADIGLSKVDDTSDLQKPLSFAAEAALATKMNKWGIENSIATGTTRTVADVEDNLVWRLNGTAVLRLPTAPALGWRARIVLDATAKVERNGSPGVTLINATTVDAVTVYEVTYIGPSRAAETGNSGPGVVYAIERVVRPSDFATTVSAPGVAAAGTSVLFAHADHVHGVPTPAQIGLGNVSNTSDANKPVSIAQAAADAAIQTTLTTLINSKVANGIVDGVTDVAPSQNAVFDALAQKVNIGTALAAHPTILNSQTTNFDTISDPGIYQVTGNGTWVGSTNGPTNSLNARGQMWVASSGNITTQMYFAPGGSIFFRGRYTTTTWQPWAKMFDEFNAKLSDLDNDLGFITQAQARLAVLTGLSTVSGANVAATDTILSAIGKLQKQLIDMAATIVSRTGVETLTNKTIASAIMTGTTDMDKVRIAQYFDKKTVLTASASGTLQLNLATSGAFKIFVNASPVTLQIVNPPAGTDFFGFTIMTVNDNTANRSLILPSAKWPNGQMPARSTAAGAIDFYYYYTEDGGASWHATLSTQDSR